MKQSYKQQLKKYLDNGGREEVELAKKKQSTLPKHHLARSTAMHQMIGNYEGVFGFKYDNE